MDWFNAAFGIGMAWNQVGLMIGGLVLVGIGGAMLATFVHWRLRAGRFTGKIIGVRVDPGGKDSGDIYYPIIEYTTPDGQTRHATADGGSSLLGNKIPGMTVRILAMQDDPETVRIKGYFLPILGMILLLPGLGLIGFAIRMAELNPYTFLVGAAFLGYIGFKIKKIIKPREEWESVSEFQQRKAQERREKREAMKVLSREEILGLIKEQDKMNRFWAPLMLAVGLGVAVLGGYLAKDMAALMAVGETAEGRIIDLKGEYSSDSYTYYPVVAYQRSSGKKFEFKSKVGSNPPMNKVGDRVDVLYHPHDPGKAIIDRGIWNWAASGGCVGAGLLLAWLALGIIAGMRRRARL